MTTGDNRHAWSPEDWRLNYEAVEEQHAMLSDAVARLDNEVERLRGANAILRGAVSGAIVEFEIISKSVHSSKSDQASAKCAAAWHREELARANIPANRPT